jgi:phage terminase small subunit
MDHLPKRKKASRTGKALVPFLEELTEKESLYVQAKLRGMTNVAACTAAGVANPAVNQSNYAKNPKIKAALRRGKELLASEVMFDRKKAHNLLMDAHANAATTTEQVLAVRELIKLHGVAAPEVKEIHQKIEGTVEHKEVQALTDEQLLALARLPDDRLPSIVEGEYERIPKKEETLKTD